MTKQEYERYKAEQEFFKCKFCGKLIKVGYNLDGLKLLTTSCIDRQCAGYKKISYDNLPEEVEKWNRWVKTAYEPPLWKFIKSQRKLKEDRKMNNKQVFAQNLKDLREKMEISQRTFAKKLGVKQAAVSAYECGIHLPTVENLIKIADFFDVSADKLLGREWRSVKVDLLMMAKLLLDEYCFKWDDDYGVFWTESEKVAALISEYNHLRELVISGQIKANVLELWMEDKRKKWREKNDM